jgi:hypothetical protein
MLSLSPYADMLDAQAHGMTFSEYFSRGTVPLPQVTLFERAWSLLIDAKTNRGESNAHPMDIDEETGEVL